MLVEQPDGRARPLRPPAVNDLPAPALHSLGTKVSDAVRGWPQSAEAALAISPFETFGDATLADGLVWYEAGSGEVALGLEPGFAVAMVCRSLGAPLREDVPPELSEVDLAVLDVWARKALAILAQAVMDGAAPAVRRVQSPSLQDTIAVAELSWASGRRAGTIALSRDLADDREQCRSLAQAPELLADVAVRLEATIGGPRLRLAQVIDLEPGDAVRLGRKGDVTVTLSADGCMVASGRPGVQDRCLAVRVQQGPGDDVMQQGGDDDE